MAQRTPHIGETGTIINRYNIPVVVTEIMGNGNIVVQTTEEGSRIEGRYQGTRRHHRWVLQRIPHTFQWRLWHYEKKWIEECADEMTQCQRFYWGKEVLVFDADYAECAAAQARVKEATEPLRARISELQQEIDTTTENELGEKDFGENTSLLNT